jgi:hypothetical protein
MTMMTLQEYLTPDPSLRGPRSWPEFMPDAPLSLTSREMSLHSASSVHGIADAVTLYNAMVIAKHKLAQTLIVA